MSLGLVFNAAAPGARAQSRTAGGELQGLEFRANPGRWEGGCGDILAGARRARSFGWRGETQVFGDEAGNGSGGFAQAPCTPLTAEAAPANPAAGDCRDAAGARGAVGTAGCADRADGVAIVHWPTGKEERKISEARMKVLEILSSENACSEWFESRDAQPLRTFETLSMEVDRHGPYDILESSEAGGLVLFRQPYVARAIQDGGAYTAITINGNGAFYRAQGMVQRATTGGGPTQFNGMHVLTVGAYFGDTVAARMVTLLHEFGHVIDLLPYDGDELDGASMRNTNEVLRHCRTEVDARAQSAKATKARYL